MNKIRFANGTEIEVAGVSLTGDILKIEIETEDVNGILESFEDKPDATSRMLYFVESDLLRGYAGYTKLAGIEYVPDVLKDIDYTVADDTSDSGFAELRTSKVVVKMSKVITGHDTDQLAKRVAAVEQDVNNINNAMEG